MITKFINKHYFTLLLVPYAVGLVGFLIPGSRELFLALTPVMLAFSFILVIAEEYPWARLNAIPLVAIGVLSFLAEYIGVNKALLFGNYEYGDLLGFSYGNVPVIIAFNWVMLAVAARSLVNLISKNRWISSLLTAILITGYDVILEPVAIQYGWWWWQAGDVPLYNYLCWFGLALLFQLFLRDIPKETGRSFWTLIVQVVFFGILLISENFIH